MLVRGGSYCPVTCWVTDRGGIIGSREQGAGSRERGAGPIKILSTLRIVPCPVGHRNLMIVGEYFATIIARRSVTMRMFSILNWGLIFLLMRLRSREEEI